MASSVDVSAPLRPTSAETDVLRRFHRAVATAPSRPAVRSTGGDLSFAQLSEQVSRLTQVLRRHGVGPGTRVGVCLPRRPDLITALLSVWHAEAAYVPLDPAYPADRLRFMADDANVALVVVAEPADASWVADRPVLALDALPDEPATPAGPTGAGSLARPAYVIYTSGSTGRPKGVEVGHDNVAHLMRALEATGVYATEPRTVAWNASISFDASVQQWIRVCRGDTIVLLDEEMRGAPEAMSAHLRAYQVTDLDLTPSHWEVLAEQLTPHTPPPVPLRLLIGGEAMPPAMWRALADAAEHGLVEAVNVYGPTECTVDATAGHVRGAQPHIGRPVPGMSGYVLDDNLRQVGAGAEGELYLSGDGVANGYANRPALTAERFVADPFGPAGTRMYRTGDRARARTDGLLEYTGRADRQVKLHGYRIEPGEIEAVLATHEDVSAVVVRVHTDASLGPVLVAYYTRTGSDDVPAQELRELLADRVPDYMVPSAFVAMAAMPRTANGKIDAAALPTPVIGTVSEPADGAEPAGEVEEVIAHTWAEVLGRESVSATDDFFALGGHSLVALRVVAQLRRRLGVVVPTGLVYQHPRLRDLAARVDALRTT